MELLAFIAFCVLVIPLQVAMFMLLSWAREKFDKYEAILLTPSQGSTIGPDAIAEMIKIAEGIFVRVAPRVNR
jgi:hypothetical protein